eukprot:15446189-Alexandrium_andersonii.AAC.1
MDLPDLYAFCAQSGGSAFVSGSPDARMEHGAHSQPVSPIDGSTLANRGVRHHKTPSFPRRPQHFQR